MDLTSTTKRTKIAVRETFAHLGWEVRRLRPHPWLPPGSPIDVRTVLDVGAADGTPGLYAAFPAAHLVVFDPLPEQLAKVRAAFGSRPLELIETALGSAAGTLELHVPERNLLKSSLHGRTALTAEDGRTTTRQVTVRRLDDVVRAHGWEPPFALKVDTEGHDLEVLAGAGAVLGECAVLYCETSLAGRFQSGYSFSEMSRFLLDRHFELVDVLEAPRGADGRVVFLECVWVPGPGNR